MEASARSMMPSQKQWFGFGVWRRGGNRDCRTGPANSDEYIVCGFGHTIRRERLLVPPAGIRLQGAERVAFSH